MKYFVTITLAVIITICLLAPNVKGFWIGTGFGQAPTTCTPGQRFKSSDGCNYCMCPPSGNRRWAGCTKMACTGPVKPGKVCTPGRSYFDGCNNCFCGNDGLPAWCTLRACNAEIKIQNHSSYPKEDSSNK